MPALDVELWGRASYVPACSILVVGWGLVFLDFRVDGFDLLPDPLGDLALAFGFFQWQRLHTLSAPASILALMLAVVSFVEEAFEYRPELVSALITGALWILLLVPFYNIVRDVARLLGDPRFAAAVVRHRLWVLMLGPFMVVGTIVGQFNAAFVVPAVVLVVLVMVVVIADLLRLQGLLSGRRRQGPRPGPVTA